MLDLGTRTIFLASMLLATSLLGFSAREAGGDEQTELFKLARGTRARSIALGPEGSPWFTWVSPLGSADTGIGRVTGEGEVAEYPLDDGDRHVIGGIAAGANGNLWFANTGVGRIGRAAPSGEIAERTLGGRPARPTGIVRAADGAIWFTEPTADRIGRIDGAGKITRIPLPPGSRPTGIAAAPDGTLWVAEAGIGKVAQVTTGRIFQILAPRPHWTPGAVVVSSDGSVWFGDRSRPRIARIDPGDGINVFRVPGSGSIGPLAAGPGGGVWYAEAWNIGWISPQGEPHLPGCVTPGCNLPVRALAVGADSVPWFATETMYSALGGGGTQMMLAEEPGLIGRYFPPTQVAVRPGPTPMRDGETTVGLWCDGGSTESRCKGTLTAYSLFRSGPREGRWLTVAESPIDLAPGTEERVSLEIGQRGLEALSRNGALEVKMSGFVERGQGGMRRMTLYPSRGR
jgi:virginiamycin B lyase